MNKKDLKRAYGLFDDSDPSQTDAKKIQLESFHESERLGVHDVKGFVEECRDLACQGKANQIALKHIKTISDCSSPGIICYFFIIVKFSSYVKR